VRDDIVRMERQELLTLLENIKPCAGRDKVKWKWKSDSTFSVKSFYEFLNDGGIRCRFTTIIWKTAIPEKVKTFVWLAVKDRITTAENLIKRGCIVPDRCVLCGLEGETTRHLLINCPLVHKIWIDTLAKFQITSVFSSLHDPWTDWMITHIPKNHRLGWRMFVGAVWWTIWKERNARIFSKKIKLYHSLIQQIRQTLTFCMDYST
jgi:hypothetical protein